MPGSISTSDLIGALMLARLSPAKTGVTHATAQQLLVRGLIDRDQSAARFKLTPIGRDVLAALLKPPVDEQDG
jgi:hypothetical protein